MSKVLALALVAFAISCDRSITVNVPDTKSPTAPSTPVVTSKIEYRVTGNANSVKIRFSNEQDGLVQLTTTLPFFSSFSTKEDSLFVSLEVTPVSYSTLVDFPFLSAQIYVNGNLFREATASTFLLATITVNGNWRR